MTQSITAQKAINFLYGAGLLSYATSRIAYCSDVRNIFVNSLLRYSSLLTLPHAFCSLYSGANTFLNSRDNLKKEKYALLSLDLIHSTWVLSTALTPAGEELFSGFSAHLNSIYQVGSGLYMWHLTNKKYSKPATQPEPPAEQVHEHIESETRQKKDAIERNVKRKQSFTLLLLYYPFAIPFLRPLFSPRFASALGIANLCYQQFKPAQTRKP